MLRFAMFGGDVPTTLAAHLARYNSLRQVELPALHALRVDQIDVLLLTHRVELNNEAAQRLISFVQRGGGLVCVGNALESCHDYPELMHLLGMPAGERTLETELIVRALDHPLCERFEARWPITDCLLRLTTPPTDATPVLECSWQMRRYSVVYVRSVGAGRVAVITIGTTAATQADPHFADLIGRAVLHVGNIEQRQPINVALLGYGAIGREHSDALQAVAGLTLHTICDRNAERLELARRLYPDVHLVADLADVLDDPAIDLVIVATPPNTHAAVALELVRAGKHVVVEKPFCITTAEADTLIAAANDNQRLLTVYQNRRWDTDFLAIKAVLREDAIGELFSVETFIGGYGHPCDYWHSDVVTSGGVFYDWGSHYLDWVLDLVAEPVVAVSASEHKRVWHDVTNADHSTIRLRFGSGVEAQFIHSDIAAALKPKWYVLGTRGAIVAQWRHETVTSRRWSGDLIEERLQAAESPAIVTVHQRGSGEVTHVQERALPTPPIDAFHRNLADHLLLGAPLAVSPESARRNIAVMEAATLSAAQHAAWVAPR